MALRKLLVLLLAATFLAPVAVAEDLSTYSGEELFGRFCASCHGLKGEGEGPVAPFFRVAPPDLTEIARRHGGEFPYERVREIIDGRKILAPHGWREMPVWGREFITAEGDTPEGRARADALINRLVDYLRSLQTR
jgi:mono/diheme cytochrome c family protein